MRRSDMTAAAKFRVSCARCNKAPKGTYTPVYAAMWINQHEQQHHQLDQAANAPLDGLTG